MLSWSHHGLKRERGRGERGGAIVRRKRERGGAIVRRKGERGGPIVGRRGREGEGWCHRGLVPS